ncbi:cadherin repeat domain-containing protein [Aequorivita viscosa]|nr:cadherin repeat domain-containing protein [Aequorivita viscosa]
MSTTNKNRHLKFNFGFMLLALAIIISCAKDDEKVEEAEIEEVEIEITIIVEDLTININEHPENNYLLGKIEAETNTGSLIFSLEEQNPEGAILLDESTGELRVKDSTLFSFEANPEVTAKVKVANEDVIETATVTIILNEPQYPEYHRIIDENNVWIDVKSFTGPYSDTSIKRKLYLDGEEIINGTTYFNLYYRIIDYAYYTYYGFSIHSSSVKEEILLYKIREDSATQKVYILDNTNNEVLLYDFSLELNDVIDLWDIETNSYATQTVSNVEDITLLNGETRKKITFESNYSIIESIGYEKVEDGFELSCFFNETTIVFSPYNNSCDESFWDQGNSPDLSLEDLYLVDQTVISRSFFLGDGGNYIENNILEKGICWSSTSQNPTINDNYTNIYKNEGVELGNTDVDNLTRFYTFISNSTLQPNTVYYLRSYSKNANGIAYSDTTYSVDTSYLSSVLKTTLISKEVGADGMIYFHLRGNLIENNFPNSANIIEKGFAEFHRYMSHLYPQSPWGSRLMRVLDGTLDSYDSVIEYLPDTDGRNYRESFFMSYVKFDNGLIVYGNKINI